MSPVPMEEVPPSGEAEEDPELPRGAEPSSPGDLPELLPEFLKAESPLGAVGAANLRETQFRQNQARQQAKERAQHALGESLQREVLEVLSSWAPVISAPEFVPTSRATVLVDRLREKAQSRGYRMEGTWILATYAIEPTEFEQLLFGELEQWIDPSGEPYHQLRAEFLERWNPLESREEEPSALRDRES